MAGKPEHTESFVRLEAEGLDIYLAREIVDRLEPGVERIEVLLPGYGRFWLRFERPATD